MQVAHVILFFPGSLLGDEFEIHATDAIDFVGKLDKGQLILLKIYGNVKCYCYVVDTFESKAEASRQFREASDFFMKIFQDHAHREERKMAEEQNISKNQKCEEHPNVLWEIEQCPISEIVPSPHAKDLHDPDSRVNDSTLEQLEAERRTSYSKEEGDENLIVENGMVKFGQGQTQILRTKFDEIFSKEQRYTLAIRRLLRATFSADVLKTHSLTGKPSPAFAGRKKETKPQLDPIIVSDIIDLVGRKYSLKKSLVRAAVTTALADAKKIGQKK